MPRDRSLDEFLAGEEADDESTDEADDDAESVGAVGGEEPVAPDADPATGGDQSGNGNGDDGEGTETDGDSESPTGRVDDRSDEEAADDEVGPARSTYDWTPAGAACSACGETVRRRWRAGTDGDAAMVCADCKEW